MKKMLLTLMGSAVIGGAMAQEVATVDGTGDLRVRLDGRVTFDAAFYLPQSNVDSVKSGTDDFRFSNGGNLSQLRLGLNAMFGKKWLGRFDADFSNRRVNLCDVILVHYFDANKRLILGHFKDPVSMENSTASRVLNVQTPMAVQMLTRGERYLGATYVTYGKKYWFAGGFYGGTVANQTTVNRGNDGYGVAFRAAYIPIDNAHTTLHLGVSGRWRKPEGTGDAIRNVTLSTLPESAIDGRRFVSTTVTKVKSYTLAAVEFGVRHNRFYATGEALMNDFRTADAYDNCSFSGWTLTGSYMLRGNQRTYVKSDAFFSPIGNVAKGGNLELIGRVGQVNLNNTDYPNASFGSFLHTGGKAFSAMLGANWYPRANVLFGINYTYLNHDNRADAAQTLTNVPSQGIDFHTVQMRAQFVF